MPQSASRTILIVDDDQGLVRLIGKALQREGFATAAAASGDEAVRWLTGNRADLMLLDLNLQDVQGQVLIGKLTGAGVCPPFIIITGQGDERVAVEMMKRGARDYLVKDVDFLQFVPAVVRRSLDQISQERRLAKAEEQVRVVRSVVDQGFSAVLIADAAAAEPRVVYINPAFAQATGLAPDKVLGKPLSALAGLEIVQRQIRAGLPSGERFVEQVSAYQTAGGERWGEWRVGPVTDDRGRTTHWLAIFRDITERRRLEKEILEISDRERQRIGQDLHDGLCQHLAGIELMSQVLEQKLGKREQSAAARVGQIAALVREGIAQTRALARGLSPVTLESEGLPSALRELAANAETFFGVACRFHGDDETGLTNRSVSIHLYRIAQEAVSNAIKHGKAREISIRLLCERGRQLLRIADNGAGLPEHWRQAHGMGLRIMRYRADMIAANLTVENQPTGGAVVTCSLPIS